MSKSATRETARALESRAKAARDAAKKSLRGWQISLEFGDTNAISGEHVRALRVAGRHEEHLAAARRLVVSRPSDVLAQIEAAYGHDRNNLERQAIQFYDEAYRLGVPAGLRRRFLVGYGSTLRNVGRIDDAIAILGQAVADDPAYPAYAAFLALALLSAGHPKAAMAAMLGCTLDVARPGVFDSYERALGEYHRELLEP